MVDLSLLLKVSVLMMKCSKSFKKLFFASFWAGIILLSSCNTRKALDAFWGISFQKTLNVSKASLAFSSCSESSEILAFKEVVDVQIDEDAEEDFQQNTSNFIIHQFLEENFIRLLNKGSIEINSPPFYIRYQRLKIPA